MIVQVRSPKRLPFTRAESRVLIFLPTHLTIEAIAEQLGRSRSTVKSHVAHIYEKLGITTRREAVDRARELGLLAEPEVPNHDGTNDSKKRERSIIAIGPAQLLVLGFEHPVFHREIIEELEKLRETDTVRVIDALAVHKDAAGEMEVKHLSNLTKHEAVELGSEVAALIGLGIEGEEGFEKGAEIGAEAGAKRIHVSSEEAWDVLEEIPNDSAAALILLEHNWAIRDAIAGAGGLCLSEGFIIPPDLVEIGPVTAEEAKGLHGHEQQSPALT